MTIKDRTEGRGTTATVHPVENGANVRDSYARHRISPDRISQGIERQKYRRRKRALYSVSSS